MGLYKGLAILSTSALLLAGCGAEEGNTAEDQVDETVEVDGAETNDEVQQELENEIEELQKELAELKEAEEAEEVEEIEEIEEIEEEREETDTATEIGTRSQPAPVGETLHLSGEFVDRDADYAEFEADLDITIIDTVRGDEAWDIIINENQFNDPAPEGKEYIVNTVEVKLHNASSEELKTDIRYRDFDYFSAEGASYDSSYVVLPDELRVELYNNGSATGNIAGLIDQEDTPLIRFDNSFFFEAE